MAAKTLKNGFKGTFNKLHEEVKTTRKIG